MANQELLAAGFWPCTVIGGGAGEETDKNNKPTGKIKARVNVKFDDGPSKGRLATYEDEVNARSSLYISRSLKAVGWKGKSLSTVADDIAAWVKETGGKTTAEVRHIEIKKGKRYDEWLEDGAHGSPPIWDKVNSIGRGPRPLAIPAAESLSDADEAMRRAMAEDGDDAQNGAPPPAAPVGDDEIPFATCAPIGLGEIARVIR